MNLRFFEAIRIHVQIKFESTILGIFSSQLSAEN